MGSEDNICHLSMEVYRVNYIHFSSQMVGLIILSKSFSFSEIKSPPGYCYVGLPGLNWPCLPI